MPENKYHRSLMKSLLLMAFFLPFVPMILACGIIFFQFQSAYKENAYAYIRADSEKSKRYIDNLLKERLNTIQRLAETFDIQYLSDEASLKNILNTLQLHEGPVFQELGVIDEQGVQVTYAGPDKLPKTAYAEEDWYRKVMKTGKLIGDVSTDWLGRPCLTIAVKTLWQGNVWVLRSTMSSETFKQFVQDIRLGETGVLFVLSRNEEWQTKLLFEIESAEGSLMDFLGMNGAAKDTISIVERTDNNGMEFIYATSLVKEGDWLLVYKQRTSEIFSNLTKMKIIALVVVLTVSLLIGANALALSKKMVLRIQRADKEKQKRNEKMFQTVKLASIGELAAGIAHEINNPVAIMVEEAGWIEDLLEEKEFQESKNLSEFQRALSQIQNQGKRCKEITHKLLSFARKTDSRVQEVQLSELMEDIITISEKKAKLSNIVINTEIQKELPSIEASPNELQQVLLNLINNGIDAMEEKGGTLSISARMEEDHIVLEVSDEGPGVPEDIRSQIFDPFFTTKPVGKGTGLGLSICYGIVKELEGEISLRSIVGKGSTFIVKIPFKRRGEFLNDSGSTSGTSLVKD
jgi:two-component system NtrC family sensor kinase